MKRRHTIEAQTKNIVNNMLESYRRASALPTCDFYGVNLNGTVPSQVSQCRTDPSTGGRDDAKRFGHPEIGAQHLLLALTAFDTPDAVFLRQHDDLC